MTPVVRWVTVFVLALLLAGCGGNGDGAERDAAPAPTVATEPEEAAPPEPETETEPEPVEPEAADEEESQPEPAPQEPFTRVPGVTTAQDAGDIGVEELGRWRDAVPGISDVRIPAAGGDVQRALWLPPREGAVRPLLVVVHSWSSGYLQAASIPFGRWAAQQGWGVVAPDFRGPFNRPAATGSDLAVRDVVEAVDWASRHGRVDPDRVFVVGFSGGGMMSLLMAGRHPDRFAGAVSWVPIYDLVDWYVHNRDERPDAHHGPNIVSSCGGDPTANAAARRSCEHRSPMAHLDAARAAGLPVYLGHGISDDVVPPDHTLRAFNHLAEPGDRLGNDAVQAAAQNRLLDRLRGSVEAETFFGGPDPEVLFARESGPVTVVVFAGTHDMVYHPGLEWMTRIAADG